MANRFDFIKRGIQTLERGVESALPGIKAAQESIQQKSFAPEKKFLVEHLKPAKTPEELTNLALGTIGPEGEVGKITQGLEKSLGRSTLEKSVLEKPELVQRSPFDESIAKNFKYVKHDPLEIAVKENDIKTVRSIREQFTGIKNAQIVRGNQFAQEIRKSVPNKLERQGMFWYKAAGGDPMIIGKALEDPRFKNLVPQLEKALNLSESAKKSLVEGERFYNESGQLSKHLDTIHSIRDNYQNRIYVPEPPRDFVKSELKKGISTFTSHAKARVFDTEFDAIRGGKTFATTDFADSLSIHNEEMARVNTAKKLYNALPDSGIASKVTSPHEVPRSWEPVEGFSKFPQKEILVAPKGIVKGLRAITDPDYTRRIDSLRGLSKYQGLIKTVDLSYSFFHHFTMAMQTIYQGIGRDLTKLPTMSKVLERPEFKEMELDFVKHTGITSNVEVNQDILRDLTRKNPDFFSKITNLPGVKQMLDIADKNSEFLFGKMQRMFKVQDYGRKISNWVADHPTATNEQVRSAKVSLAKEVNNAYGGLNWEAMGMTKSNLSILRTLLLAPDWTISNIELARQSITGTPGGTAARRSLIGGAIKGMVLTEFFNKMVTGHFTDENSKGHGLEVEVAPNVYISFLRGGLGDLVKWGSMVNDNGIVAGTTRFAQGKLSPLARTGIGLASGVKYTGAPISKRGSGPIEKTINYLEYIGQSAGPVPFGLSNQIGAQTSFGRVITATGLGRYSSPKSKGSKGGFFGSSQRSNRFNF